MAGEMVGAIEAAFSASDVTGPLGVLGENAIAAIHAGYSRGAGNLDWGGPLVSRIVEEVIGMIAVAFDKP